MAGPKRRASRKADTPEQPSRRARRSAHARAAEPAPPSPVDVAVQRRSDRVFLIAQLMASQEWSRKRSKALAVEWGTTPGSVRNMAAEASRLLDYTTKDREHLVALVRLRLRRIVAEAQDDTDAVYACRTLLEHLGEMRTRQKVELAGFEGGPIHVATSATPETAAALVRAAFGDQARPAAEAPEAPPSSP